MRELWGVNIEVGMDFLADVVRENQDRAKVNNSLYWAISGNDFTVTEAFGMPACRRLYESRYAPTRANNGSIIGVSTSLTDVTERVHLANQKRALEQKLLESSHLTSLGLMVGCVTHDFNNVLLPILLNSELALKTLDPTHPAAELLREIISSVGCASALTKQLLSLRSAESSDKELVNLNDVVKNVFELSRVAVGRHAELSQSLDKSQLLISANVAQLRQVIVNLLTNASEAARDESLKITIETSTLAVAGPIRTQRVFTTSNPNGEYAVLTIHDNGSGLSSEQLERIFQPFFSTKGSGRGLGLTAVQGIVNNHKGFLAIDSTPNVGSSFRVGFPIAKSGAQGGCTDDASLLVDELTPFQPLRLLIVDDNGGSLKSTYSVSAMLGHSVEQAAGEAAAMDAIITGHFDVVLLDADMTGSSSQRILEAIPDYIPTPIILMSATGQLATLISEPRVHGVLMKPFSTEDLIQTLHKIQPQNSAASLKLRARGFSKA